MRYVQALLVLLVLLVWGCGGGGGTTPGTGDDDDNNNNNNNPPVTGSDDDLEATIDITGSPLLDLDGGNAGSMDEQKIGLRVIDPIEEVDRGEISVDWTNVLEPVITVDALPAGRILILQVDYLPSIDLETSDLREVSQAGTDPVTTSIPFRIPADGSKVTLAASIDVSNRAPSGGRFVDLSTLATIPGDNPDTAAVEDGYTLDGDLRLDYATRLLNRDDDNDGNFTDEAYLADQDRDCMSDRRLDQVIASGTSTDTYEYVGIDGVITHLDLFNGELVVEALELYGGGEIKPNDEVLLYFDEETYFSEILWIDDHDVEIELFPGDLNTGDYVEIDLTAFTPASGSPEYWIDDIWRYADDYFEYDVYWEEGIITDMGAGWIEIDGWDEYDLADDVWWTLNDGTPAEQSDFEVGKFVELTIEEDEWGDAWVIEVYSLEDDPEIDYYYGEITYIFSSALAIDGEYFQTNYNTQWLDWDFTEIGKAEFETGMDVEVKVRYIDEYTERVEWVRIE